MKYKIPVKKLETTNELKEQLSTVKEIGESPQKLKDIKDQEIPIELTEYGQKQVKKPVYPNNNDLADDRMISQEDEISRRVRLTN